MPGFSSVEGIVGAQPVGDLFTPTTTPQHPLGMSMHGVDPFFGWGAFVYAKSAALQGVGAICYLNDVFVATAIPNTANTGAPIIVAKAAMPADTYGWYQYAGMSPVSAAASVAAGVAVGVGAAGQVGTNTAGKQILGARVAGASTYNITKSGTTQLGGNIRQIVVPNTDGLFVGMAVSGTGVGAAAVITKLDPNGNLVTVSVDSTAAGTVTVTFTYTNYILLQYNAPHVQGAIT